MEFYQVIILVVIIAFLVWVGYAIGKWMQNKRWEENLPDIIKQRIKQSRAVLGGQFSEQLAPYLPDFPYSPTECKFIGKPIDFVVFKGLDKDNITEVKFVEVKSGKSKVTKPREVTLRDAINKKKVKWEEYRIPEDITKKKEQIE